jgi:hypothetical protein
LNEDEDAVGICLIRYFTYDISNIFKRMH